MSSLAMMLAARLQRWPQNDRNPNHAIAFGYSCPRWKRSGAASAGALARRIHLSSRGRLGSFRTESRAARGSRRQGVGAAQASDWQATYASVHFETTHDGQSPLPEHSAAHWVCTQ